VISPPVPSLKPESTLPSSPPHTTGANLIGVGTAVPDLDWPQDKIADTLAATWNLRGEAIDRWRRINAASGIEHRHAVMPIDEVVDLTTQQRMEAFERFAPELAMNAARAALIKSEVLPEEVTDLIVVSCTGFSAPGVDVELVRGLGLSRRVRRTMIGFMGCFGAINGLRAAVGACAASPDAVALVVCVELCSLHVRRDDDAQNMVASALFADGAAAVVLRSEPKTTGRHSVSELMSPAIGRITVGHGLLLDRGRDWMTWRITDAGFAMTLAREVPVALRQELRQFVDESYLAPPRTFVIHPGGPGILDAADAALTLQESRGLECSREILRRFGNMSSCTVLFVLEESLRRNLPLPAMLLAFGPGLTIESLTLEARV